jgi:hypothetical protein
MKRVRTRVLIETSQVSVIRKADGPRAVQCKDCTALMVAPDEASVLCSISLRSIFRLIEAGRVHFTETPQEEILVCLDSLNQAKQRGFALLK